jgi:phospholipid-binding lipoprotein MlaA
MSLRLLLAVSVLLLGGCASQTLSLRKQPDETPAATEAAAAAYAAAFLQAAGSANNTDSSAAEAAPASADEAPPITPEEAPPMYTYDPWERLNRFTYRFNARFDEAIFLPVANAYRRTPSPFRSGVHNFFGNVGEIDSIINYGLQFRLKYGWRSIERFVINSTIGIGGLIDVATKLKLPGAPTGFATTLAKWGMHPGPYLVIPFLGPSTLRGGIGFTADYALMYEIDPVWMYRSPQSWPIGGLNAIDQRANVNFRYYATGSPFEYETIRFLYVRKLLIEDEGLHSHDKRKRPPSEEPAGK